MNTNTRDDADRAGRDTTRPNTLSLAQVRADDPVEAVRRLHAELDPPDAAAVLYFCTPALDAQQVGAEMSRRFGDTPVLGCTTAGEFGPAGYLTGTLAGLSLPAAHFTVVHRCIEPLSTFNAAQGRQVVQELLQELEQRPSADGATAPSFAFLMVDGLSGREELLTRTLQAALGPTPLVGGSAGDGLAFGRTLVHADGRTAADRAVLLLVRTALPVQPFMTQHFVAEPRRVVVTAADAPQRIVHEIDGLPAAEAYAQLIGVPVEALDAEHFAAAPMAVMIGGVVHIRSISKVLPGGSLKFHCAIDEGIVLRVTRGVDLVDKLDHTLRTLTDRIGPLQAVLGCDCILRRLEIEQSGLAEAVAERVRRHHIVGFSTYGEQYRGVHVNQTFTGVAIGQATGAGRG